MKNLQFIFILRSALILMLIIGPGHYLVKAQSPQKLFQDALMLEEAEGELDQAIDIFYKINNDVNADRSLRANALMHIGICYEKLGRQNARNAFEMIISEYPDQYEVVALAKEKLEVLNVRHVEPKQEGIVIKHMNSEQKDNRNWIGGISPDGNSYAYVNWDVHEILIYDMVTNTSDTVTTGNTWFTKEWSNPQDPIWAPDGSTLAYMWYAKGVTEIRTININGENRTTIIHGANGTVPKVHTFTPDQNGIIGILNEEVDDKDVFRLALINIADTSFTILRDFGTREVDNLSFSPDGKYLLYSKDQEDSDNDDIYIMSYPGLKEIQLTTDPGDDRSPAWSRKGDEITFFSKRFGTNDLYKLKIHEGHKRGKETILKKNVGKRLKVMGVDNNNALFYFVDNSRFDIYTLDMVEAFEEGKVNPKRITDLGMRYGGMAPRFSQDGKYICYISYQSNYHDEEGSIDKNFVNKYYVGIYDTETGKHREMDIDLYENHAWADIDEYIPEWSPDGTKLLLHGVRGENYEGGFYTVDVNTAEVKPVITTSGSKAWTWKRAGRHPYYSQKDDVIYYTSTDWKKLIKYDLRTDNSDTLFEVDNGFRFRGVYEDDKYCLVGKNRKYYYYDMVEDEFINLFDEDVTKIGIFKGFSPDREYMYTATDGEWAFVKEMSRRAMKGDEDVKVISIVEEMPNGRMWNGSMHPDKNIFVFEMKTNIGLDIFKLEGVFD